MIRDALASHGYALVKRDASTFSLFAGPGNNYKIGFGRKSIGRIDQVESFARSVTSS